MTETNPFVYYLPPDPQKLVLGSFPCFNGKDYGDFFYSGSGKNHFWTLLSEITGMPAENVKQKKTLCTKYHIALSDIALKVERARGNCSDSNLHIKTYNYPGIHRCLAGGVSKIFFTSRLVEKHFRKMFPGLRLPTQLLTSPSPAANRHIGGLEEYRSMLKEGHVKNVYDYRLMKYRELLFGS